MLHFSKMISVFKELPNESIIDAYERNFQLDLGKLAFYV